MSSENILDSIDITVDRSLSATSVATFRLSKGNFIHVQTDMRWVEGGRSRYTFAEKVTATLDGGNVPFGRPREVSHKDHGDRVTIHDAVCSNCNLGLSTDDQGFHCKRNGNLIGLLVRKKIINVRILTRNMGCSGFEIRRE